MGLELAHPTPLCGIPDQRPWLLADIHYLHFAVLLATVTAAIVVGGSLLTPPSAPSTGEWGTPDLSQRGRCHPVHPELGWGVPMVGSALGGFSQQTSGFQLKDLTWWTLSQEPPQPSMCGTTRGPPDGECVLRGVR